MGGLNVEIFLNDSKTKNSHTCVWCTEPVEQGPYDWLKSRMDQTVSSDKGVCAWFTRKRRRKS